MFQFLFLLKIKNDISNFIIQVPPPVAVALIENTDAVRGMQFSFSFLPCNNPDFCRLIGASVSPNAVLNEENVSRSEILSTRQNEKEVVVGDCHNASFLLFVF